MGIKTECVKNFFKKPSTKNYPKEKLEAYPHFRGKIKYFNERCIGCQQCFKNCPANAITFYKKGRIDFDMGKCCYCGLCVDVCPVAAIAFTTEFEYADNDKKKFIVK
ncbi:4Fe-4S binding protein [Candidatus Woesearchaeota archaeon]|nr:4Fe-4S binding protein [Candidatus Woesearchaeota archaeon]